MTIQTSILNGASGLDVRDTINDTIKIVKQPRDRRRVTALGDSRVAAIWNDIPKYMAKSARSPLNFANAMLGARMVIEATFGVSGDRTDQFFARLDAAIATGAGTLYLQGGVNNIGFVASSGNVTYTHAVTNEVVGITNVAAVTARDLIAIADKARAAGMHVVIEQEVGANGFSPTEKLAALMDLRTALSNYARLNPAVTLHDATTAVIQPGSLLYKTGYSADGTHVNPRGAYYWGKSLALTLERVIPQNAGNILVASGFEIPANGRRQLLANPIFNTATGGTLGTNASGTVPAGWQAKVTGPATVTVGVVAEANGLGNNVTLDVVATDTNAVISLEQALNGTSVAPYWGSNLVAGDIVETIVKLEILGNPTNLTSAYVYSSFVTGSGGEALDSFDLIADQGTLGPNEPATFILRTRRFTLPAAFGQYPYAIIGARFATSGAGNFSVKVHQIALRRVG